MFAQILRKDFRYKYEFKKNIDSPLIQQSKELIRTNKLEFLNSHLQQNTQTRSLLGDQMDSKALES